MSLVQMEWHPAGWSVFLPLLIFPCTMKSRSSLLALAHPGGPGKRAVKWLWWLQRVMLSVDCRVLSRRVSETKEKERFVRVFFSSDHCSYHFTFAINVLKLFSVE